MSLIPISRETLQKMKVEEDKKKAEEDEKMYRVQLESTVQLIYKAVIQNAKSTTDTLYQFPIPEEHVVRATKEVVYNKFYITNIEIILRNLQDLFPECKVEEKTLSMGYGGKYFDVSTAHPSLLGPVRHISDRRFIIVDWS